MKLIKKWYLVTFFTVWGLLPALTSVSSVAFYHFGFDEGLPETNILSITQDSIGFIWLAGENSVYRFDGFEFKQYWNEPNNQEKSLLNASKINSLFADSHGKIWIGSENGIAWYDFFRDRFIGPVDGWQNIRVTDISEDDKGNLWIGTDEGVAKYNPESNHTIWFTGKETKKTAGNNFLPNQDILQTCWQSDTSVLIATIPSGLYILNPAKKTIKNAGVANLNNYIITEIQSDKEKFYISTLYNGLLKLEPKNNSLQNYTFDGLGLDVHHFSLNQDSIIWLATNNGLIKFNRQTGNYTRFTNIPNDPLSMERTAVSYVFCDNENNLWLSLGIRGINYGLQNVPFSHLSTGNEPYTLDQKEVTAIEFDKWGNMWLGYESGMVEKHTYNPLRKQQVQVQPATGSHGTIFSIFEDSKERTWLGGWKTGLLKLNEAGNAFEKCEIISDQYAEKLQSADIRAITEGPGGNIWFTVHGLGLAKYNPETKNIRLFRFNPDDPSSGLSNDFTFDLCFDKENNLWISSSYGISRLELSQEKFTTFLHEENNPLSLSDNTVNTVFCDSDGLIWAGTQNGLNVFIPGSDNFQPVLSGNNFAYQNISSIEQSDAGEIWVSTQTGLMHINYLHENDSIDCTADYYGHSDGLISTNYFDRSSVTNSEGIIYFCGNEGVDMVFPDQTSYFYDAPPQTLITEISVYNQSVYGLITKNTNNIPQLSLKHDQQMITFRFTSIDFNNSGKQNYRYMLEGFDKQWIYPQNEQVAIYTNLYHGKYVFKVQSQTKDNKWAASEDIVSLIIKPPFWATLPFIVLASFVFIFVLYFAFRIKNRLMLARQRELEKMIDSRTSELQKKNEELAVANQTKNKFFSIISHDLRGPFSGLLGILDLLVDHGSEFNQQKRTELLETARQSANNIFNLLENLLIWSRTQMHQTKKLSRNEDVSKLLNKNIKLKKDLLKQKEITLDTNFPDSLKGYYDPNMIDTVIRNILSNAIKFTHPKGKIEISAGKLDTNELIVSIADSGIGLTEEERNKLFDLEKKSRNGTQNEKGTGLGLIICHEFITQNHGRIWAESNKPSGTIFNFTLPAHKN